MSRSTTDDTAADRTEAPDPDQGLDEATPVGGAADGRVLLVKRGSAGRSTRVRSLVPSGRAALALVVAAAAVLGAGAWWLLQRDDLPEDAAFRLGDEVVTADDVARRIDALEALYGVAVPSDGDERRDFERDAAKSMAVALLLEQEAERRDVVVPARAVDETLQQIIAERYPDGGRTAFVAALGELGATEEQVRDEIADQLLVSRLFDVVAGGVTVDEAELREIFRARRADLATPVRRELGNIVVADRSAARAVLAEVRGGTPFAEVARTRSLDAATRDAGGALGLVARNELEGEYAEVAFSTPVGQVFGPVRTESGWNVGRVERQVAAVPATYAQVREQLRQTVLAERSVELWRDWLAGLLADNEVEYADAFRPDDPDAVPDIDQPDVSGR